VPNLLTLRAGPDAALVRFDAAFFDGFVVPLLRRRGFAPTVSARAAGDLCVAVDDVALDRFLAGRDPVPAGRLEATARVWRALLVVDDGRPRPAARSRDIAFASAAGETAAPVADSVRAPDGRRVKARARRRSPHPPAPPSSSPTAPASWLASDPAAFALAQLLRLAERVVAVLGAEGDNAAVALVDGIVVVDGVVRGPLPAR
jgi:hypothetical protein